MLENLVTSLLFGVFWLCAGSAIAAFTYRWPRQQDYLWRQEARELLGMARQPSEPKPAGFHQGRSVCPHCNHSLAWRDLLPVFSFLSSKGRCRYCQHPISYRYPTIELLTLLLALPLLWMNLGQLQLLAISLIIVLLLIGAVIDSEHYWIPDFVSFGIIAIAILQYQPTPALLANHLLAGLAAFTIIYLLRSLYFYLRDVEAIGLGDAKFLAALIVWLGLDALSWVLLLASLTGLVIAVWRRHKHRHIAFGPYLAGAAYLYFLGETFWL